MKFLKHFRIFPVLVVVGLLSFFVRFGEFVVEFGEFQNAYAEQEAVEETHEAAHSDDASQESEEHSGEKGEPENYASGFDQEPQGEAWRDANDEDYIYPDTKNELYQDLAARRKMLEEWEQRLNIRAAQIEVAERELDEKVRELTAIKMQIESFMSQQEKAQSERIQSLVKIYEGMKAKDAARIFDTLDVEILLPVMSQMSERKSAPILAAMNPERARTVTSLLIKENQLPTLQ